MSVATMSDRKQCRDCGAWKPLDEFHRTGKRGSGKRSSYCRVCSTERVKRYQELRRQEMGDEAYRSANAARVRRYRSDPEKREKNRAINRALQRALWRLADLHRDEFDRLVSEERLAEGLDP